LDVELVLSLNGPRPLGDDALAVVGMNDRPPALARVRPGFLARDLPHLAVDKDRGTVGGILEDADWSVLSQGPELHERLAEARLGPALLGQVAQDGGKSGATAGADIHWRDGGREDALAFGSCSRILKGHRRAGAKALEHVESPEVRKGRREEVIEGDRMIDGSADSKRCDARVVVRDHHRAITLRPVKLHDPHADR